jgi:hypothetical protein
MFVPSAERVLNFEGTGNLNGSLMIASSLIPFANLRVLAALRQIPA